MYLWLDIVPVIIINVYALVFQSAEKAFSATQGRETLDMGCKLFSDSASSTTDDGLQARQGRSGWCACVGGLAGPNSVSITQTTHHYEFARRYTRV